MPGLGAVTGLGEAAAGGAGDGTILYIDPNDPQAAEILQQAGLRLTEDGTVASLTPNQTVQDVGNVSSVAAAATMAPGISGAVEGMMGMAQQGAAAVVSSVPSTMAAPIVTPASSAASLGNLVAENELSMPLLEETKPTPVRHFCLVINRSISIRNLFPG